MADVLVNQIESDESPVVANRESDNLADYRMSVPEDYSWQDLVEDILPGISISGDSENTPYFCDSREHYDLTGDEAASLEVMRTALRNHDFTALSKEFHRVTWARESSLGVYNVVAALNEDLSSYGMRAKIVYNDTDVGGALRISGTTENNQDWHFITSGESGFRAGKKVVSYDKSQHLPERITSVVPLDAESMGAIFEFEKPLDKFCGRHTPESVGLNPDEFALLQRVRRAVLLGDAEAVRNQLSGKEVSLIGVNRIHEVLLSDFELDNPVLQELDNYFASHPHQRRVLLPKKS